MTIGIDIRGLSHPQRNGVSIYTENLLGHLLPLDPQVNYKLFYSSYNKELPHYEWLYLPNVQVTRWKGSNRFLFASSRILNVPKIDKLLGGVDVFFSPHFFLAPLSVKTKRVTTFHDLSFERFPQFFTPRQKIWHQFQMQPTWQARFSDAIIAVSDSTKNDISQLYNVDPAKIQRIYSGVSAAFKPVAAEPLERFRRERKLPDRFILSVATLEPRKNTVGLIKAFEMLKRGQGFEDCHLIIAGGKGWRYREVFMTAVNSEFSKQIIFTNQLWDWELPFYYSAASVFVYPSFFEGFGFPPLEAMACGTPVVASNNSSLPEVVGHAGLLVDPYSISDIFGAIRSILQDVNLRRMLIEKGFKQAARYSWARSARETLDVLKRV
ncbi:MAG: glycosyltransferase family 1 protein [Candidatus Yanofskybacteria bacterium]|nr:glycosyltransferase family 1 protein [Candidatus Yanofskybacteria bacterium]